MFSFLAIVLLAATASATTFSECEDVVPPTELRVNGCDEEPCNFKRGEDIVAEVEFTAHHLITKMKPQVKVAIMGVEVEYPVRDQNVCENLLNAACPLEEGDTATYKLRIPVMDSYPQVPLIVTLSLIDTETNKYIVCFSLKGKVV